MATKVLGYWESIKERNRIRGRIQSDIKRGKLKPEKDRKTLADELEYQKRVEFYTKNQAAKQ